jgi:general secretion pathway protein K
VKPYYTKGYSDRDAHRFHARYRAAKKMSLLLLLLGILCILISLLVFAFSFTGTAAARHSRLVMSLCYVGTGCGMLCVRWLIEFFRNRGSSKRTNYQPRLSSIQPPPKQSLPLNGRPGAAPAFARDDDGAVLVLVLILLALIAGLVVETQISARFALRRQQGNLLQARVQQAAADAAWSALRRLADDEDLAVDDTNEVWAATEEILDPSGISTRVKVADQNRYYDLNNVTVNLLPAGARPPGDIAMDIMTLCGDFAPVERIDSLTDWVDTNDDGFAEKARYLEKTPPYEAANRPLYALSEILWVNGFNRAYFVRHERHSVLDAFDADVVNCLTVLPGPHDSVAPVNVNTASREVLLGVLGVMEESLVQLIKEQRNLRPIRSIDQFFAQIGRPVPEELRPYLDVKSRFFSIEAQAHAEGHTENLQVLAQRSTEGNIEVLQWVF